jgi:FecR protein
MGPSGRLVMCGLAVAAGSVAALAQSVISARSGMIHFVEGQVYLGDQPVETKFGNFPEVKENGQLRTEDGRAEVLLTPGVFLRLGENSSFRMVTNRLIDTRLEFLSGSAIVEAEDLGKDNSVTVVYKDATVHVAKKGLYRIDSDSGELRVFEGLAEVAAGDNTVEVRDGHAIALNTLAVSKFDKTATDALDRWSARRGEYVAMANVGAANSVRSSLFSGGGGYGTYGGYGAYGGSGLFNGGWYFNPYFGMYSFVPGLDGAMYSPYGYRFWNPFDVYSAFMPGYYYYPSGYRSGYNTAYNGTGYSTTRPTAVATKSSSAVARSSASAASSSSSHGFSSVSSGASSAPIARGGGSSGGGGGSPHH